MDVSQPGVWRLHDRDVNAATQHFGRGAHGDSLWRDGKTRKGLGSSSLTRRGSVKQESPAVRPWEASKQGWQYIVQRLNGA